MAEHIALVRDPDLTGEVDYAYAAIAHAPQRIIFTAGACPLDANGDTVAVGDISGQAEQTMVNLASVLAKANAGLTDVVQTRVYVASCDQGDLVAAWDVVKAHFGEHDAPGTLLGVTVLGYRGRLVEVEAVAATS